MKKLIFIILLATACNVFTYAQSVNDSITIKRLNTSIQFYKGDTVLHLQQLVNIMKSNEEAHYNIDKAYSKYLISSSLLFSGGFLIGYPIGRELAGKEADYGMFVAGMVFIAIAIPTYFSFRQQAFKAVEIYNLGLQENLSETKSELHLYFSPDGIGLSLRF